MRPAYCSSSALLAPSPLLQGARLAEELVGREEDPQCILGCPPPVSLRRIRQRMALKQPSGLRGLFDCETRQTKEEEVHVVPHEQWVLSRQVQGCAWIIERAPQRHDVLGAR
jgi:hypothetical protein